MVKAGWAGSPHMRRRDFISIFGSAAATWPLVARAQQRSVPVIGFLGSQPASAFAPRIEALRKGLRELGYVEGKNLLIDFEWADTVDQLPRLARRLVESRVDLIFAPSSMWVEPARQATKTIPIVFANHADPVGIGHVESLAHPGGNITGLSMVLTDIVVKQLEILHEATPRATRIGIFWNPTTPAHEPALKAVHAAAEILGVRLHEVPTRRVEDYEDAIPSVIRENVNSLMVMASPIMYGDNASRLIQLTLKHRLPAMFGYKEHVQAGGLMSYAPDVLDLYRRSAVYIDKILKGTKPADLPVEQASKYYMTINLKTAKALGLTIPPTLLVRADEVIE
jgi:putative tryptophan/tyrosine transport system substrate-binding protein